MFDDKELLMLLKRTAMRAGNIVLSYFNRVSSLEKADHSLITKADLASDEFINEELSPLGFNLIDEEKGFVDKGSEYTLVIDPLDGTTNFFLGIPFFNISIALFKDKKPLIGVVFNPVSKELFFALNGEGAFVDRYDKKKDYYELLSSDRLLLSEALDFRSSVLTFCHKNDPVSLSKAVKLFDYFKHLNPKFRQLGAAALELCLLAQGKTAFFIMPGINLWDVAAGALIAKEAGLLLTDFSGRPFDIDSKELLATNKVYHEELLKIINEVLKKH